MSCGQSWHSKRTFTVLIELIFSDVGPTASDYAIWMGRMLKVGMFSVVMHVGLQSCEGPSLNKPFYDGLFVFVNLLCILVMHLPLCCDYLFQALYGLLLPL